MNFCALFSLSFFILSIICDEFDVVGEIEQSLQIMDGSVPLDGLRNKLKLFPLSTESLLYDTFRSY